MRFSAKLGLAAATALTLGASTARAQARPVELGADAQIGFGLDDPKTTTIDIPSGRFRAAFFMHDERFAIEPSMQLNYASNDLASASAFQLDVGLMYHTSTIRSTSQVYFRPFLGLLAVSTKDKVTDVTNSGSQLDMGIGVGMKWPLITNRLDTRGEIQLAHYFDTDKLPAQTNINLMFGLSFFTR